MATITFVHPDGRRTMIEASKGETIMEVATANAIDEIVAECGGSAVCGTCHVFVDAADIDTLPPPKPIEDELLGLTAVKRRAGSRLSCQITVDSDDRVLTVHLPESQT